MADNNNYVENYPIVLPRIQMPPDPDITDSEDKVDMKLGDLYNCRTSKIIGSALRNATHTAIDKKYLAVHPKRELDYKFTQIKSTKDKITSLTLGFAASGVLNLLFKEIVLDIGSISFTITNHANLTTEEVHVRYNEESHVVRLLPSSIDIMDKEKLVELFESGQATHIVTEATVGAQVLLTITFESKTNKQFSNVTASGIGKLLQGPLSAILEAGLTAIEGINGNQAPKIEVEFESVPEITPPVIPGQGQIATALDLIRNIGKEIGKHCPFPQLDVPLLRGALTTFFLVPIAQFIPIENPPDPLFVQIESSFMADFQDMLSVLNDFQVDAESYEKAKAEAKKRRKRLFKTGDDDNELIPQEPPIIGYFKKRIVQEDFRLKRMLVDPFSPFTIPIQTEEDIYQAKAKELFDRAHHIFTEFKEKKKTLDDLDGIMAEYRINFKLPDINDSIAGHVEEGKRQLSLLQAGDVDDDVRVDFLTSETDINNWLDAPMTLKIIIKTSEDSTQTPPVGFLWFAYQFSKFLPPSSIGVTMPHVYEKSEFSMKLYQSGMPCLEIFKDLAMESLRIISIALGYSVGMPVLSRFYHAVTASGVMLGRDPLALPLREGDMLKLQDLVTELRDASEGVIICESFVALRDKILEQTAPASQRWKIVCTVNAVESIVESVQTFFNLKSNLVTGGPCDWIVATFELEDTKDAPLLTVFRNGTLCAICHDALDVLLLRHAFSLPSSDPDLEILSPRATSRTTLYANRSYFARSVMTLFRTSFIEEQLAPAFKAIGNSTVPKVEEALSLAVAYAERVDPKKCVLSALSRIVISRYENVLPTLKKCGWLETDGVFSRKGDVTNPDWIRALQVALRNFVFIEFNDDYLLKIGVLVLTLEHCVRDLKHPPKKNPENPFVPYNPKHEIDTILEVLQGCGYLKTKAKIDEVPAALEPIERYLKINDILITTGIDEHFEKSEVWENFKHFRQLMALVDKLVEATIVEEEPPRNPGPDPETTWHRWFTKQETESDFLQEIVVFYIQEIELPDVQKDGILKDLSDGFVMRAINTLGQIQYADWLKCLHDSFKRIQLENIIDGILSTIGIMDDPEFLDDQFKFIWGNSKFGHLIRIGINDEERKAEVMKELIRVCCGEGRGDFVPPWIPLDIAKVLLSALLEIDPVMPGWTKDWVDISSTLRIFQRIVVTASFPSSFMTVFTNNLMTYPTLKSKLEEWGVLFHWNNGKSEFTEEWSIKTTRLAVEKIMESENDGWTHSQSVTRLEY